MSDDIEYGQVPADFPRAGVIASVAGATPKLALVAFEGKYYLPGDTPPERYARWDMCEDLAQKFHQQCLETKAGKRAHMPETEILQQYLDRLCKTGWGTDAEMRWVMNRAAELLGWPKPASLINAV
jgi:hypothetical protein